jgi:hypothetical protein
MPTIMVAKQYLSNRKKKKMERAVVENMNLKMMIVMMKNKRIMMRIVGILKKQQKILP